MSRSEHGRAQGGRSPYPTLFKPARIGALELKNRVIKAPQLTRMASPDGAVTERMIRHYRELARGGAGLVMVEFAYVDDIASKAAQCQLGASSDEHIPGLAWLADTLGWNGAKAGLQLAHCGRQRFLGTTPIKSASPIPWPALYERTGLLPETLTISEIKGIVEAFGAAATRAVLAGFDVVEIHAAHGYLLTNFLSPHTNKRTDRYGGPLENRMRVLLEVMDRVRSSLPARDVALSVRLSAIDYEPDGIVIEETLAVCRALERLGVSAIHVSGGHHARMAYEVSPMLVPPGPHVWAAEAVKREVAIPVIASGSITLPELAEEVLASGKADFVALGRPLWADPQWPAKARAGRAVDIRPCIRCNDGCMERTSMRFRTSTCSVNPRLGNEGVLEIERAEERRRVAVVGGGPAGLEAARLAAGRGHEVCLYERSRLGGLLHEAAAPTFKADLRPFLAHLIAQVKACGVTFYEREATAKALAHDGYDDIVVAVGAVPRTLEVPCEPGAPVVHALKTDHATLAQKRVVVVGGGLTGCETALALAEAGTLQITICEAAEELMRGDVSIDRATYAARLAERGVQALTATPVTEVRKRGVVVPDGLLPAEVVVIAVGYAPNRVLAGELRQHGSARVHEVGNCLRPGKIHDAVHAAFRVALAL